ncbi:hypothetical protein DFH08DRAFT_998448 [Mycena albidolilacea]|uniref:Uncharacterized protein n=1 Tax=Mycena albidolilacea TaxID=1033008 RepID=A0AAD7A3X0_9AGAR|nr:hypothetical protein DFH08DRAFT_998448 [Mycena albidolilacea]
MLNHTFQATSLLPSTLLLLLWHTASLPDAHSRVITLLRKEHHTNILFTNELQRCLAGTGIYRHSMHPGLAATNIYRGACSAQHIPVLSVPRATLLPREIRVVEPQTRCMAQLYAATVLKVKERDWRAAYLAQYMPSSHTQNEDGQLPAQFRALYGKLVAEAHSEAVASSYSSSSSSSRRRHPPSTPIPPTLEQHITAVEGIVPTL